MTVTEIDARNEILTVLAPYQNKHHGKGRYNTPWRPGADGGTLAVTERSDYALGLAWFDHKTEESGNGITLAQRLNDALGTRIQLPPMEPSGVVLTPKRKSAYESLEAYAQAHGVPVDAFEACGWREVRRGGKLNLLAFAFNTATGTRYRYADEAKSGRKFDHDKGTTPCWYGLEKATQMADDGPIIVCNGEPSTIAAQWYGVPACCVTGGERGSLKDELFEELRDAWDGPILIAFDCDDQGARSSASLAAHLRALGVDAKAVDLGGRNGYDLANHCQRHPSNALESLLSRPTITTKAPTVASSLELVRDWRADGVTAAQLQYAEFPPEVWIVEGILPAGACLLAAKPKKGKSWLALQGGVCVSMGRPFLGRLAPTQGRVLYLDLEGTQRRIKKRLRAMLGVEKIAWPENFHIFTEWPQGPDALAQLEAWLQAYPDTRLVVIDVLASFRRPMDMRESFYQYDRETVKPINDLLERYECAGILVHHMNKSRTEDVFDSISGSTGLPSVTNTQWAMGHSAEDRKLVVFAIQGRDIEGGYSEPLGLRWNDYNHAHEIEGTAAEIAVSVERKALLDALDDDEARTPKELAEQLGKPVNAVKRLLGKLIDAGQVDKAGYGQYVLVRGGNSGNSGNSGHSGNSGNSSVTKVPQELPPKPKSYRLRPRVTGGG